MLGVAFTGAVHACDGSVSCRRPADLGDGSTPYQCAPTSDWSCSRLRLEGTSELSAASVGLDEHGGLGGRTSDVPPLDEAYEDVLHPDESTLPLQP